MFIHKVFATGCNKATEFCNPITQGSLQAFLEAILSSVVYILFPIIVLMVVYTGFLFIRAQGVPAKLEEARRALVWTLIGGAIILGALALSKAIEATVKAITP
jgi:Type IV secretion system pilin